MFIIIQYIEKRIAAKNLFLNASEFYAALPYICMQTLQKNTWHTHVLYKWLTACLDWCYVKLSQDKLKINFWIPLYLPITSIVFPR